MHAHWSVIRPVLSVCILSIPRRAEMLAKLLVHLDGQRDQRIELLINVDECVKTVGRKRQECLDAANGSYVCYLDDDDWCANDYIPTIADACQHHDVDVVSFDQEAKINGGNPFIVNWSLQNPANEQVRIIDGVYQNIRRPVWHMCPWRASLAKRFPFIDASWGEDWAWLSQLNRAAVSEHRIPRVLHYYRFSDAVTETDKRAMAKAGR